MIIPNTLITRAEYSDFAAGERGWRLAFKGVTTTDNAVFSNNYAGERLEGRFMLRHPTAGEGNVTYSLLEVLRWT